MGEVAGPRSAEEIWAERKRMAECLCPVCQVEGCKEKRFRDGKPVIPQYPRQ